MSEKQDRPDARNEDDPEEEPFEQDAWVNYVVGWGKVMLYGPLIMCILTFLLLFFVVLFFGPFEME